MQPASSIKSKNFSIDNVFELRLEREAISALNGAMLYEDEQDIQKIKTKGFKISVENQLKGDAFGIKAVQDLYKKFLDNHDSESDKGIYLTSYFKKDYKQTRLFKDTKLEKLKSIINSDSFLDSHVGNYQINNSFGVKASQLINFKTEKNRNFFKDRIINTEIGKKEEGYIEISNDNNYHDEFNRENSLFINNPKYQAFIEFIQRLKNIAVSFYCVATTIDNARNTFNSINKYNTAFKINNYVNLWSQWYLMWQGDKRTLDSGMFLIPNSTVNFISSAKVRAHFEPDHSGNNSNLEEKNEFLVVADRSSLKPIINMTGLYASYLSLSFVLAGLTIFATIRKDFV